MFWKILVACYYFLVESDVMMMKTPMYITLLHYSKLPRLDKGLDTVSHVPLFTWFSDAPKGSYYADT